MTVREVAPFDEKQWKQLKEMMLRGPTEKQLKTIKEGTESVKDVEIIF